MVDVLQGPEEDVALIDLKAELYRDSHSLKDLL